MCFRKGCTLSKAVCLPVRVTLVLRPAASSPGIGNSQNCLLSACLFRILSYFNGTYSQVNVYMKEWCQLHKSGRCGSNKLAQCQAGWGVTRQRGRIGATRTSVGAVFCSKGITNMLCLTTSPCIHSDVRKLKSSSRSVQIYRTTRILPRYKGRNVILRRPPD